MCEYVGEIISDSEADHREDDSYLFDLDNRVSIEHPFTYSRLIFFECLVIHPFVLFARRMERPIVSMQGVTETLLAL